MKCIQTLLALLLAGATAQAALYTSGTLNSILPDGNPNGISSTINVSGLGSSLSDVNFFINLSGGFNGDIYAYLSHDGVLVPLLNRVGAGSGNMFGFSTAGFSNITLDDAATGGNIHDIAAPAPWGAYTPDGGSLSAFNGSDPNGSWTLFVSDLAGGGGDSLSVVESWSLDITAVPEPVGLGLGAFGVVLMLSTTGRYLFRKFSPKPSRLEP